MTFEDATPEEEAFIKAKVVERLKRKHALRDISRNLKVAMTAAVSELRGVHPDTRSSLEFHRLENATEAEILGLQSVYAYLESVGLTYTLECIQQELGIPQSGAKYDLLAIVRDRP
jgi:hypothetical protein